MFLCASRSSRRTTAPRHGSGPSTGAALRAAPLSLSQTFRICASSLGQRDQRWRLARGQTQNDAANLVSSQGGVKEHSIQYSRNPQMLPQGPKRPNLTSSCFTASESSKFKGWWQKWHDFWVPQARGAVPVQARKVGKPWTHTDPHPPTPGPGRNQARSSEEGGCQRGVLLEHFHFHVGWKWEMHGGLHAEMPTDPD